MMGLKDDKERAFIIKHLNRLLMHSNHNKLPTLKEEDEEEEEEKKGKMDEDQDDDLEGNKK
eukprot:CAMPEP_0201574270 /NCGR_PEP_ID=MMETSP0190_2-20130828/18663_1 /ASSEMBLY_ACC=CAM_ASM_000263 /TAXON_ID=37353 /ORGANISM="Rosalina sp." /LENGTH=60 /DNA_ID=CAMNT_0048002295 /DNA_START=421 /DNA_END=603 /DNA_ORIENTATION=-